MLLKLRYDGPLSNFAFSFNLRRSTEGSMTLNVPKNMMFAGRRYYFQADVSVTWLGAAA
jgi:hypothetical protein